MSVHGQEIGAEFGGVRNGALNSVADIEKFHVEEDVLAIRLEGMRQLQTTGK